MNEQNEPHNLKYYEKKINDYKEGVIKLENNDLINLADEILNFENPGWLPNLHLKYKYGCDYLTNTKWCYKCNKVGEDNCEYTKAMTLAYDIYRNLVSELPAGRDILRSFLGGELLGI